MSDAIRAVYAAAPLPVRRPHISQALPETPAKLVEKPPTEVESRIERAIAGAQHPGPPPAFQTSLLELEADLSFQIKQMSDAREKMRNGDAAQPLALAGDLPEPDINPAIQPR